MPLTGPIISLFESFLYQITHGPGLYYIYAAPVVESARFSGAGSCPWAMALETKIWALGVLTAAGVSASKLSLDGAMCS